MFDLSAARGRRSLAGTGAAALAVLSFGATGADAASTKPKPKAPVAVRVLSPSANALVAGARVPVSLRVGPKVTRIRVFDGAKEITGRFQRSGRVYRASLPRTTLKPGGHTLVAQAFAGRNSGGTASVKLIVGKPANGVAAVGSGSAAGAAMSAGPVGTRAYSPTPGTIPVTIRSKKPTVARLSVNGRRVADMRADQLAGEHSWLISRMDGLKAGTNRLKAVVYASDGSYTVKRWTIERDSTLPLAEAGPRERTATTGRWLGLDATKSRPARRGDTLRYAWRIVNAPKGSKAVLRNPTAAKPKLKADVPGVYQVALRATSAPRAGQAAAAQAPAASEDVMTVDAATPLPEQGLYVDTGLFGQDPQNKLSPVLDTLYVRGVGYTSQSTTNPDIFVQLDATTLLVVASGDHTQVQPKTGTITIGVWQGVTTPYSPNQSGSEVWVGTTVVSQNTDPGNPGTNAGNPTSNLHGWLHPATSATTASWVDSDMLQVQTRASTSTATSNTMLVNNTPYTVTLPAGAQGGYQLLMLDHNGTPMWNLVYPITGDAAADTASENAMVDDMQGVATHLSFMIEGFGNLTPVPEGSRLSNFINQGGGNPDVISDFDGTTDSSGGSYGLIFGPTTTTKSNWTAEEVSHQRTGGSASLSALLVRDPAGANYIPFTSDAGGQSVQGSASEAMLPLIYQPPTDWTNWMRNSDGTLRAPTAAESAAFQDILSLAVKNQWVDPNNELCPAAPDAIRGYYCNVDPTALSNFGTKIVNQLSFDAGTANGAYTQTDYQNVQKNIQAEAINASDMRSSILTYQGIFGTEKVLGSVDETQIAKTILGQIDGSGSPISANTLNTLSALTDMASAIPEIGPVFTFMSGMFSLDSDMLPYASGTADLTTAVQAKQASLASIMTEQYVNTSQKLNVYGDYLASDPVKLENGGNLMAGQFALSGGTLNQAENTAADATNQFLWGSLLAPAYTEFVAPTTLGTNPSCTPGHGQTFHPFSNIDTQSGLWTSGTDNWFMAEDLPAIQQANGVALPGTITKPLFSPIDPSVPPAKGTNVGAVMPYFANTYLSKTNLPLYPATYSWNALGCQTNG